MTDARYDAAVAALRSLESMTNALRRRIDSHPDLDADRPRQTSMVQEISDLTLEVATALGCVDVLPDEAAQSRAASRMEKME